ncbi:hypothetical protein JCM3770_006643 [Rhodotorula araucariae]
MPFSWEMGAKTWQHPEVHKRRVEEEKAKAAALKKKKEEDKLAKEIEKQKRMLLHKELVHNTRARREQTKDEYLAQLKADVARLEKKRTGDTPQKGIALYDVERAKERTKEVGGAVKLPALEMLALREKGIKEKQMAQEKERAELADRHRRELLEYMRAIGVSQSGPRPPHVPKKHPHGPLSLLDDPEFWRLPAADRHKLELMNLEDQMQYGFGPYPGDIVEPAELCQRFDALGFAPAVMEEQLGQIRNFTFIRDANPPGVTAVHEPIALSLPLEDIPDLSTLSAKDKRTALLLAQDEAQRLRDEFALYAVQHFGANALVDYRESGIAPAEDAAALQAGCVYELRAQGTPARIAGPPAQRHGKHPHPAAGPHDFDAVGARGQGHASANGGAAWDDAPLFGLGQDPPDGWDANGKSPLRAFHSSPLALFLTSADGGAVWRGLPKRPGGVWSAPAPGEQAPLGLRSLPWGAQQYVKKMRERQEREERELANADAAAAGTSPLRQSVSSTLVRNPK